jgi:hypothetical protein
MTPEEKALIATALKWQLGRKGGSDAELRDAAQAVRISRLPAQGPEAIPCMVGCDNGSMFCILPKGHEGSFIPSDAEWWQHFTHHEGYPANDPKYGRRGFDVREPWPS